MVSFQCEACGDVLTKKKLDPHRGRCHYASFTCIDCMVHFEGNAYKSHTSCMTEAEKYEKGLYQPKEKKGKGQGNANGNGKAQQQSAATTDSSASAAATSSDDASTPMPETKVTETPSVTATTDKSSKRKHVDAAAAETSPSGESSSPKKKQKKTKKDKSDAATGSHSASTTRQAGDKSATPSADVDLLMKLISKHGASESGVTVQKLLKKYHQKTGKSAGEGESESKTPRSEAEEALWKALRVKKNDRGEVVLFA
ncbi:hypothetical protein KEM52_006528 [Ascosphaera acerosa]|nr:hypothetical protein KEM52_006528 [Ascosphaera acerosa]